MIAKSRSSDPKPDPILFTSGGPGVMTTLYGGRDLTCRPFLDERDFSVQLVYDGTRWWIVNLYWASETDQARIPGPVSSALSIRELRTHKGTFGFFIA
jgi:hypothetical protein